MSNRRDLNVIRSLLHELEQYPADVYIEQFSADDTLTQERLRNLRLMQQGGLIKFTEYGTVGGSTLHFHGLTAAGCEFADLARSDVLWARAEAEVLRPGASYTFEILKAWLERELRKGLVAASISNPSVN